MCACTWLVTHAGVAVRWFLIRVKAGTQLLTLHNHNHHHPSHDLLHMMGRLTDQVRSAALLI